MGSNSIQQHTGKCKDREDSTTIDEDLVPTDAMWLRKLSSHMLTVQYPYKWQLYMYMYNVHVYPAMSCTCISGYMAVFSLKKEKSVLGVYLCLCLLVMYMYIQYMYMHVYIQLCHVQMYVVEARMLSCTLVEVMCVYMHVGQFRNHTCL